MMIYTEQTLIEDENPLVADEVYDQFLRKMLDQRRLRRSTKPRVISRRQKKAVKRTNAPVRKPKASTRKGIPILRKFRRKAPVTTSKPIAPIPKRKAPTATKPSATNKIPSAIKGAVNQAKDQLLNNEALMDQSLVPEGFQEQIDPQTETPDSTDTGSNLMMYGIGALVLIGVAGGIYLGVKALKNKSKLNTVPA